MSARQNGRRPWRAIGDGRLMTFFVTTTVAFVEQTVWSGAFGAPTALSTIPGGLSWPSATAGADGRLVLFATANESEGLWRLEQSAWGGAWNPAWIPHGLPANDAPDGSPVVVRDSAGCLQVFVVGSTSMWNLLQTSATGAWSGWTSLGTAGGGLEDRPAVGFSADGRLELFVRGNDNALWHIWQLAVGGSWSEWVSFGNGGHGFQDHPAMAPNADGRLEVFITGNDGNLYHAWQTAASNGWDFWDSLGNGGPPFTNGPAVAPNGDGRLEVFVLGGDGALWTRSQTVASTNDWSEWVSLGTALIRRRRSSCRICSRTRRRSQQISSTPAASFRNSPGQPPITPTLPARAPRPARLSPGKHGDGPHDHHTAALTPRAGSVC